MLTEQMIEHLKTLYMVEPKENRMSDLISRQDAINAIVAWTVEDRPDIEMPTDLVDRVNALPSAEPEIIKCKDCVWYGRADKRRFYRGMDCLQKRIDTIVPDRDFCSRAERREKE